MELNVPPPPPGVPAIAAPGDAIATLTTMNIDAIKPMTNLCTLLFIADSLISVKPLVS
jgi:hypothetical protein